MSFAARRAWRCVWRASTPYHTSLGLRSARQTLSALPISCALRSESRWTTWARGTQQIRGTHDEAIQQYDEPTIYALSTASGRAAIAIIRISGPACLSIYRALCPGKDDPKARHATLRTLYRPKSPVNGESVLDSNALLLYFPAPKTVTGEDVLELHVHGGPAVVKAVLAAIPQCDTELGVIRYAEPGEFTRRAFMNDRLDLTQVEALGDTLSATTEQQRRLSVRGTTNSLARRYETWRQQLLYARGELEALIDFSEDQHFDESPAELCASVSAQVQVLRRMLQVHSQNAMRGEMLRNGISISLLGAPNVGKSSLLNRIVGREAAIVSHEAGTTRDVVEVGIDLGGFLCRLGDTAGLRKAKQDAAAGTISPEMVGWIEEEGMRRAKQRAIESDVVIVVLSFEKVFDTTQLQLDPEVTATAADLVATKDNVLVVINKMDLSRDSQDLERALLTTMDALSGLSKDRIHLMSCKDSETTTAKSSNDHSPESGNVQSFLHGLIKHFGNMTAAITPAIADASHDFSVWQESLGASERHRMLLESCITYLDDFIAEVNIPQLNDLSKNESDIVIAAEHLRGAADCLAKITGRGEAGDVEEVLGVVFEKFCVGK